MFLGHTPAFWAVATAAVYDLLTFGLLIIGYRSLQSLRRQMDAEQIATAQSFGVLQKQVNEARQTRIDSVRPVVVIPTATLLAAAPGRPERAVEICASNVGMGPALDVEVIAYVHRIPPGVVPGRVEAWELSVDTADQANAASPRSATAALVGIGAHANATLYLLSPSHGLFLDAIEGCDHAFVFVSIRCKDLYGNEHRFPIPSGPSKTNYIRRGAVLDADRFPYPT